MFESVALRVEEPIGESVDARTEVVRELQARIRGMQRTRLDSRALPTHPALGELLPGGALQAGGSYAVAGSTSLALALLQGPSAGGAWCAVVGVPDLGVEAAAGLGIDLERLVLVPHPGEHWAAVTSALIDVVSVVLVRPPAPGASNGPRATPALTQRIGTRLRAREAALVALLPPPVVERSRGRVSAGSTTEWPGSLARLRVTRSDWAGIGAGFGHLQGRQVTVASASESWPGRERSRRLWLPGPDQRVQAVEARPGARSEAIGSDPAAAARGVRSRVAVMG